MKRICLVALIGLPAVGKTTLCDELMQMKTLPFNILHLCYDNYVNFNSEYPTQYKQQRDNILKYLTTIIASSKDSNIWPSELEFLKRHYKDHQHKDFVILCDDNHYYVSMRYKLYQLAREYNIGYCQIYFETNVELAIENNSLRCTANKIPKHVIIQMSKRLEAPNVLVNKWEENTLTLRYFNLNDNSNDILSFIIESLGKPVQPLQLSNNKPSTSKSQVHDLDLLIRKHISNLISCEQGENKKLLAKNLNDKRKDILKKFQLEMSIELHHEIDLNKYVQMLN